MRIVVDSWARLERLLLSAQLRLEKPMHNPQEHHKGNFNRHDNRPVTVQNFLAYNLQRLTTTAHISLYSTSHSV
jgi:hypothetical protein